MRIRICVVTMLSMLLVSRLSADELIFVPVKIDGPVHDPPNRTYWYGPFSECASVADFDSDGDLDIAAGRNWYEAPKWIKHSDFRDGAETNGPETDDNSEFAMDVNRDGHTDVVSSGWMRMKGAFWYENPGPAGLADGRKWNATRIHSALSMEGVIHGDIDGDGDDDILCNHWSLKPNQGMTWIEHLDHAPWLIEHVIGTEGETHGNGLGDIDGDGRCDIVTPIGWYQQPARPTEDTWVFHADYKFQVTVGSGAASHPILIHDVNQDGRNDIILGAAHTYGLAWLEQQVDSSGKRTFQQHWVEKDFGQFHTMVLDDLDGDRRLDLVTGKRLFAHHGRDVSCYEPLFAFWYEIDHGKWTRRPLAFNHLVRMNDDYSQRNPAPNFVPAVGMKLNTADMDADGDKDIVVAGKGGLYIFYNEGPPKRGGPPMRLPPEEEYPSWTGWKDQWPEEGKGSSAYTLAPDEHGMVLETPDGRTVLRYMTSKPADTNLTANSVCCLYPVFTPRGVRAVDLAPGDHRHHRGIFLAWHASTCGDQRADFWGWGEWASTEERIIVSRDVQLVQADAKHAVVRVKNDWLIGDRPVIKETTTITVREQNGVFVIDEDFHLAAQTTIKLDHTAFGGFCVKGRKEGESAYYSPEGKLTLADPHHLKPESDWPAKPWYDYVIQLTTGETVGVAVIDHHDNPPSLWHNLKPIAMVNPCIVAPEAVTIESGKVLRLRYRVIVHDGPPPTDLLVRLTDDWRGGSE